MHANWAIYLVSITITSKKNDNVTSVAVPVPSRTERELMEREFILTKEHGIDLQPISWGRTSENLSLWTSTFKRTFFTLDLSLNDVA